MVQGKSEDALPLLKPILSKMQDIYTQINDWTDRGQAFALATVAHTWGSAPRMVGASLAIGPDWEMAGSVSGGCVEGAVLKAAREVMEDGQPRYLEYGVSHEEAWTVGLSCGGTLHVFLERFFGGAEDRPHLDLWHKLKDFRRQDVGCVWLSAMDEGHSVHALALPEGEERFGAALPEAVFLQAGEAYRQRKSQVLTHEGQRYFAHVFPSPSRLVIVGATHITADLISLAKQFDFETYVIDPRGIFSQRTHFPVPPDHMLEHWPEEVLQDIPLDAFTYVVLLTHDPKIDDQALKILLPSQVGYIGALGGRKTQQKRRQRMEAAGFDPSLIDRIHGPVGVDIHAKRPKEIALSILAELIQVQNQYL